MKKFFLILLFILMTYNAVSAVEIIYPKSEEVTINSDKTFFVGNETPENGLTINSELIKLHPSGGFFHPVELLEGENNFVIDNGEEVLNYKIIRPAKSKNIVSDLKIINYETPAIFKVNEDNTPLRSTPRNEGLNRLQHLNKEIPLTIVGEYGDFYKVRLARDDYAWVLKSALRKTEKTELKPVRIESYTYEELPNKRIFTLKLNTKTPYVLSENSGLDLVLYNVEGFYENKYEFHINNIGKAFGYKSYYKNRAELVIEVKNYPNIDKENPLKRLTITVDPGHGGGEYGAIGCLGDKEKDINLDISLKLKELLINAGAEVVMTREDDKEVSLNDRVKISQEANSDLFISIHNNALPDSQAYSNRSGTSVYWFYPQSKQLANSVLNSLTTELQLNDDKIHGESFAVIRNTHSPSILIEVGYMINPEDNAKLIDCEFQQKTAEAILHGLENYLNDISK